MRTVYIFYLCEKDGANRQVVLLPDGGHAYIRVERAATDSLDEALDLARPQTGEFVMNSHRLKR